jgi:hypothetical protein
MAYATVASLDEHGVGVLETFSGTERFDFIAPVGVELHVGQTVEFATKVFAVNVRPARTSGEDRMRGFE